MRSGYFYSFFLPPSSLSSYPSFLLSFSLLLLSFFWICQNLGRSDYSIQVQRKKQGCPNVCMRTFYTRWFCRRMHSPFPKKCTYKKKSKLRVNFNIPAKNTTNQQHIPRSSCHFWGTVQFLIYFLVTERTFLTSQGFKIFVTLTQCDLRDVVNVSHLAHTDHCKIIARHSRYQ